jgi:ATP/maltotriose-dependent transcriptional regulator MalT
VKLIKQLHDELSDQLRELSFRLESLIGDEELDKQLRPKIRELLTVLDALIEQLRKELILIDGKAPTVFSIEIRQLISNSIDFAKELESQEKTQEIGGELRDLLSLPKNFLTGSRSKFKPEVALTTRERDVLKLLPQGLTAKEMALSLFLTEATIKSHLASLYRKLEVGNRVQAIAVAIEAGLIKSK